jgi:ubiquinone/menaquinone biosynthesis C-methylase UbiE
MSFGSSASQYDSLGGAYDFVGGLDFYHRIFWGVSTGVYKAFAERATLSAAGGLLLDAGCGSMLFSAGAHKRSSEGFAVAADRSIRMLRLARGRLKDHGKSACVTLLQTDILSSPFRPAAFDVVLCLHVAHVVEGLGVLLAEMRRVLKPGGKLFMTSVVLVGGWRDRYLRALHRRRIMALPRNASDVQHAIHDCFGVQPSCQLVGSMLLTETLRPLGGPAYESAVD